jgi:hypothetical protein
MAALAVERQNMLHVPSPPSRRAETLSPSPAVPLSFKQFFTATDRELKPSQKLLTLNGRRVRMEGFIAELEEAPKGAFYLCPHPVTCDEGGAGTGDLPPETVLVIVRSAGKHTVGAIKRPVQVTGVLEISSKPDSEGRTAPIRLYLDAPAKGRANIAFIGSTGNTGNTVNTSNTHTNKSSSTKRRKP